MLSLYCCHALSLSLHCNHLRGCKCKWRQSLTLLYTSVILTAVTHMVARRHSLFQAIVVPSFTLFSLLPFFISVWSFAWGGDRGHPWEDGCRDGQTWGRTLNSQSKYSEARGYHWTKTQSGKSTDIKSRFEIWMPEYRLLYISTSVLVQSQKYLFFAKFCCKFLLFLHFFTFFAFFYFFAFFSFLPLKCWSKYTTTAFI